MPGRLELRRWIELHRKAYAVAHSHKGQYVAVGTDTGMAIYNLGGHEQARYSAVAGEDPVHCVCAAPEFAQIVVATRLGTLATLEVTPASGKLETEARELPLSFPDIHSLAFSEAGERIAIGHLGYALTVLNLDGEMLWQQQDVEAAALSSMWRVAFTPDGTKLYAGSAGGSVNWLVSLDAATGALLYRRECAAPVIGVAALPDRLGVATLSPGEYYSEAQVTAYTPDLENVLWEQPLDNPATAIAADVMEPALIVSGGYEGVVTLLNAESGATLATTKLNALVDALALVQGKFIAAVTQDGSVGFLRYLP